MANPTYIFRKTDTHFIFPVIKGWQGSKEMFSSQLRVDQICKFVPPIAAHSSVEDRSQRKLSKVRAGKISDYIVDNLDNYVLPSLTISVLKTGKRRTKFHPIENGGIIGELHIPIEMNVLINDGQHRRAGIEEALEHIGIEYIDSVSLTIYTDVSKEQAEQIFTDINLNAVRPSGSINALYNHRDPWSQLAVAVSKKAKMLVGRTEYEAGVCTANSLMLFPLTAIVKFCKTQIVHAPDAKSMEPTINHIVSKLDKLADIIQEYKDVTKTTAVEDELLLRNQKETKEEMPDIPLIILNRRASLAPTVLALEAIGLFLHQASYVYFMKHKAGTYTPEDQTDYAIDLLKGVSWIKNKPCWQGRAINMDRILKSKNHVILTANHLMMQADIKLPMEYEQIEYKFQKQFEREVEYV